LKGKIALVTGGSRGIGAAIVKRLAQEGAKVYFTYNASKDEAEKIVSSLKGKTQVIALECDVRKNEDIERVVDGILEKEETLDILVNSAGIIRDGLFLAMADEDWQDVLETNLGSVYRFCKAVTRQMMMQGGGRIVNISSVIAEVGGFGQTNYAASKGAVNAFTRSLALELAPKKITVNAVAPGMVKTSMSEAARAAFGEKIMEKIPLGSFAEPDEIASVAVFLASDEAGYITGQILTVDGGLSLLGRR
jgi:3-oxoacyl-[acyl-carrier protein] reductase